jgi:F-type H+-transporting ATPase subunit delta
MKSTKGATRYAKALLELSIEQNKLAITEANMNYLIQVNNDVKEFHTLIHSPIINADKKIKAFEAIFSNFDKLTTLFLNLIIKNKRESILPEIAQSFIKQLKAYNGITPITIVSAVALNEATKIAILAKVQSSVSGTLEVTEKVDASLIGGFIVQLDGKQIDTSVLSQFNNLKQRLTK